VITPDPQLLTISLVRNRKDVVWRNLTVASEANDRLAYITVWGDAAGTPQGLAFSEPELTNSPASLFAWGAIVVDLGPGLFARWTDGGSLGSGIASVSGTAVTLQGSGARLRNILLNPGERFTIRISMEPFAADTQSDRSRVDVYRLDVVQIAEASGGERTVGGVRVALKTKRPLPPPPPIP
jgi:hypothetical protein